MSNENLGERLWSSLETHETEVKHAIQSIGDLETEVKRTAEQFEGNDEVLNRLEGLGRALEKHELQLEEVIDTLNQHKGIVREVDDVGKQELQQAMEQARHKARQESRPLHQTFQDTGGKFEKDETPER